MEKKQGMGRREFVKKSAVFSGGLLMVKPETAFGTQANSTVNIALLGCGGRGTSVAVDFVNHTNSRVSVVADILAGQLDAAEERFNQVNADKGRGKVEQRFRGPDAHLQATASDADMVLVATPPYYHPEHLEAAVEQGKHVYLEKPVATDVAGCKRVLEVGKKADGKVSVDVGFQIRRGKHFAELTRRIHDGALGDIACAQGFYFAGDLPRRGTPEMSPAERKIRDWFFDRALSGDILLEQNVHIIDVFNWVLKAHPLRAKATAARKVRTDIGDVSDHYVVTYYYPNDVRASFMSTQFLPAWGDVCYRFFGPEGFSEAFYVGGIRIRGKNEWEAGESDAPAGQRPEIDPLGDATPNKAIAFIDSIQSGKFHNELKHGTESCLAAILGRQAAYEGRQYTWQELLDSNQSWEADLDLSQFS